MKNKRRDFIKKSSALAALTFAGFGTAKGNLLNINSTGFPENRNESLQEKQQKDVEWPVLESAATPKICMVVSRNATDIEMRQVKQIGVNYVHMGGPQIPWKVEDLSATVDRFKTNGLNIINMMISGFPKTITGKDGRDAEIEKVKESIHAAGEAGIPVVEYNFYANRLMEGYYEIKGRGGAGMTGFKALEKDLPPNPETGSLSAETLWNNITYFLKAIVPVAEKAGVRLALHPNDPPVPVSHGSAQIIATFRDFKKLCDLVESPSNGMTFDCGVSREMGEDPVEVCRYLGSRDRINHVHFRNVTVEKPYAKYAEVFYAEGFVNMFAVMKELIRQGYNRGINPEHPRALDYDKAHPQGITTWRQYPGGGGYAGEAYDIGYTRAMMQAVYSTI